MRVLVTGAERHQGLAVIRGLGLAGIPVVACGSSRSSMGFYSRFAVARARYRSPSESPAGFVEDIVRVVQDNSASIVMPAVESTLVVLNEWRDVIERYATLAAPSAHCLEYVIDKGKTLELARRLDVPTPRTVMGESIVEILERACALAFPVAIKPRGNGLHHATSHTLDFKVQYACTPDELRERLQPYERDARALLVQEYVPGVGRCVAAVCRHGEPLALLAYSRDREFPLSGGVSVVRKSIPLEEPLARHATALLREIAWHGVAMVEFKYDSRVTEPRGGYTLMEINGRFQASTALSLDAGLNLPHLALCVYCNGDAAAPSPPPLPSYRVGVEERWLRGDLMALREALAPDAARSPVSSLTRGPSRPRVLWSFLRDFRPRMRYDEFKWYDWKPGIVECGAVMGMLARWVQQVLGSAYQYCAWVVVGEKGRVRRLVSGPLEARVDARLMDTSGDHAAAVTRTTEPPPCVPRELPPVSRAVEHIFTVDVEEYFQVSAFDDAISRDDWPLLPSRIERNIDLLLDLLARHGATGTFFTLGWIAEKHPAVIRTIGEAGHEIASHGWWHRRVSALSPEEFRSEVRASKAVLEDVCGTPVVGFRAPNFSIVRGKEWAFDVLLEEGYRYDSSLFPVRRPGYGYPDAMTVPHVIQRAAGQLVEFPMATLVWKGMRLPAAGGGYFRHFPYALTRRAFQQHSRLGTSGTFYIHTWEIDQDQPRLAVPWVTRVRHYRGLTATLSRLERLLSEFRFTSAARHTPLPT